jgi:hypothetical protein
MNVFKLLAIIVVPLVLIALAGCGSDSNGSNSSNSPFSTTNSNTNTNTNTATTPTAAKSGVIMFTSAAGLAPGSQTNMLDPYNAKVDSAVTSSVSVLQLIPFKVTDSNGNPRVGVPVTLSLYSIIGNPNGVSINFLVPPITEPNQQTITSDSAGMGIFNVSVVLASPVAGSFTASTVVFKAVTNDSIPVTAYVGRTFSLTTPTTP